MLLKGAGKFAEYRVESLLLSQALGIQEQCTSVLGDIAELEIIHGNFERAARLWGEGTALRKKNGVYPYGNAEFLAQVRAHLGNAVFERIFAEGAALTLHEAITLAIS